MRGVYIPHFDQILVEISGLGVLTLIAAPMGVKFDMEEGTFGRLRPKVPSSVLNFTPIGATCHPVSKKPQNQPLSNLDNRHFALRAMLPVN